LVGSTQSIPEWQPIKGSRPTVGSTGVFSRKRLQDFYACTYSPVCKCCTPRKSMLRNIKPVLYPAAWAFRRLHVLLHCAMLRAYCDE